MPFPQLGIENIPQTLAEKIEGKNDYEYSYSRDKGEPWGIEEIVFAVREDVAPGGVGWRHSKAEKAETRLRQNCTGNAYGG